MTNPMIRIHNTEIDEVIDREMTDEEFATYEATVNDDPQDQADMLERATAKAALLERLGITADEAHLLLG